MGITGTGDIFQFCDNGTVQTSITVNSDGSITARRNGTTVIGTSGPVQIRGFGWCYVEAFVTVHPSAGVVTVKVNGNTVLSLTGVNTIAGAMLLNGH